MRLAQLLAGERRECGGRRSLGPWRHAVLLVLRWFIDGTRVAQLATDDRLSRFTGCWYLHEGIDVLGRLRTPGLHASCLRSSWPDTHSHTRT